MTNATSLGYYSASPIYLLENVVIYEYADTTSFFSRSFKSTY